jgi:hypothetical protein
VPPFLDAFWRLLIAATAAATEGVRVIRREPRAFVVWTLLWMGVLLLSGAIVAFGPKVVVGRAGAHNDLWSLIRHYGIGAAIILPLFAAAWTVMTTAICRAVFEPDQRAIFHLKIGIAELRLALINLVTMLVTPFIVSGILAAGVLVARPFLEAAPTMASEIGAVGLVASVGLLAWLFVRLSLIPIETFAEGRIHVTAYWPLTRGRFWYLFWAYVMVGALAFVTTVVIALPALVLLNLLPTGLEPAAGADILRRASLLAAAAAWSFALALIAVAQNVLICSCQAYAYRYIAGPGPEHMAGLKEA